MMSRDNLSKRIASNKVSTICDYFHNVLAQINRNASYKKLLTDIKKRNHYTSIAVATILN